MLTDITIRSLKPPPKGAKVYPDHLVPGFGVRVTANGVKAYVLTFGRQRRRITLSRVGILSLSEARSEAKRRLAALALNQPDSIPFDTALAAFLETHCKQRNRSTTAKNTEATLRNHFRSFQDKDLDQISASDITRVTDALLAKGQPHAANNAMKAIKLFFRWSVRRQHLVRSPAESLPVPARVASRDRILSAREVTLIWEATEAYGYPFGTIVQLLILTGQRRNEISSLRLDYVNELERTITIPGHLAKNGREHVFPYGDMTARLLERCAPANGYLFPARGSDGPFCGWSKSKVWMDKKLTKPVAYRLHDFRRYLSTGWAALGTRLEVTERYLNHVSGSQSGVAGIYNRHTYLPEMRDAVARWEAQLVTLVGASRVE